MILKTILSLIIYIHIYYTTIFNGTYNYYDFLPTFIGHLNDSIAITFDSKCNSNSTITMNYNTTYGTVNLSFDNNSKNCEDIYLIATTHNISLLDSINKHAIIPIVDKYDYDTYGIRIFHFENDLVTTIKSVLDTLALYIGVIDDNPNINPISAKLNVDFLADKAHYYLESYSITDKYKMNKDLNTNINNIKSGDILGILRLDGLDPLICWATQSYFGHTTVVIDIDGKLYVTESQSKSNYWPKDNVQKTPIKKWFKLAERANYNVIHFKLNDKYNKKFNENIDKAVAWFNSVENLSYGFQNFLFGWIDTPENNFPYPTSSQFYMVVMGLFDPLFEYTGSTSLWNEALNKRIGTTNLSTYDVFNEAVKKKIMFTDLITIPENDNWIYKGDDTHEAGPSMVCNVFICRMYQEAKLFDNNFNCTEFTPFDLTEINIYSDYIQILGDYKINMNKFNYVETFDYMRQSCPSLGPDYLQRNDPKTYNSC